MMFCGQPSPASRPVDQLRSSAAQDNRHRSSPSRQADLGPSSHQSRDAGQPSAGNNNQQRRRSPPGGRVEPGGRVDHAANRNLDIARVDYPGSRSDMLAGARAEVPGLKVDHPVDGRAAQQVNSPHRQSGQDPSQRHGARHAGGSPSRYISDQYSRQARHESPGRRHESPGRGLAYSRPNDPLSQDASRGRHDSPGRGPPYSRSNNHSSHDQSRPITASAVVQPGRRDDSAKVIMPSSSDIILRPAVPQPSDQRQQRSACEHCLCLPMNITYND